MSTRLIQILTFANIAPLATLTLPHQINLSGVPQAPDYVAADASGFTITVTTTQVSVTNNGVAPASVNVWLELKHSISRELGNAQGDPFESLVPRPFVAASGGGGGGPVDTTPPGFYGFANLGDRTVNAGGTVLTSSLTPALHQFSLFFHDLTITNNTKLQVDPSIGGPSFIFVDGTLTITAGSSIDASGSNGSGGGNGGTGGANSFNAGSGTADGGSGGPNTTGGIAFCGNDFWSVSPKNGGTGGNGGVNAGGNPQFPPGSTPFQGSHFNVGPFSSTLLAAWGVSDGEIGNTTGGGGGGADTTTVRGGGGGGGGGILVIYARHVNLVADTLIANAGNGENAAGPGPGNAGGGAGGLGGVVILVTQDEGVPANVASVLGGTGGAGFGAGTAGTAGSNGEILIVAPSGTTWVH